MHHTAFCIVPDLNSLAFPWLRFDSWLISQVDDQIFNTQSEANEESVCCCQALKGVLVCNVSSCNDTKRGTIHNSVSVF